MSINYIAGTVWIKNFSIVQGSKEGFTIHRSSRRRCKPIYFTDCTITGGFDWFEFRGDVQKRKALIHNGGKP